MSGRELTNMFENGVEKNWDNPDATDPYGRVVSNARPFIDETVKSLNENKGKLVDSLKKDLKNLGFETL